MAKKDLLELETKVGNSNNSKDKLFVIKEDKLPKRPDFTNKFAPSGILDRVKNFLPELQKANTELEEKLKTTPAEAFVIDSNNSLPENEPYIELDLGLGVFEEKKELTTENIKLSSAPPKPVIEISGKNDENNNNESRAYPDLLSMINSNTSILLPTNESDDSNSDDDSSDNEDLE